MTGPVPGSGQVWTGVRCVLVFVDRHGRLEVPARVVAVGPGARRVLVRAAGELVNVQRSELRLYPATVPPGKAAR